MKQPLLELLPNRVRRNYSGGRNLDAWEQFPAPQDSDRPEDWLGSTTPAINPGLPDLPNEGLGRVRDVDGRVYRLADLFREHGDYYLGADHLARLGPKLGFLAKLLDSGMRLHTQVHPTREFARRVLASPWGKLECYVILAVRPDSPACLRLGFQRAPDRAAWREIIAQQDLARMDACFDPIPVAVGQVWWIPGGMVHALGAGLLLLEVQEPSDLVVRCEFEREGLRLPPEARFMGRDLDFCLDVFDYTSHSPAEIANLCQLQPEILQCSPQHRETRLVPFEKTGCFEIRRLDVSAPWQWPASQSARLAVVARGSGQIELDGHAIPLTPGSRFFVAAQAAPARIEPTPGNALDILVCQ